LKELDNYTLEELLNLKKCKICEKIGLNEEDFIRVSNHTSNNDIICNDCWNWEHLDDDLWFEDV